jgi:NTE family protein
MPEPRPLNLALQGGGAHGAFAWGVLDRLLEDGRFTFDGVAATSAGAMNAVALAQGLVDGGADGARESLAGFWQAVSEAGRLYSPVRRLPWETAQGWQFEPPASFALFDALTRVMSPYQFNPLNLNPLRDILEARIDFARLREASPIKLFLNATNLRNGRGRSSRPRW